MLDVDGTVPIVGGQLAYLSRGTGSPVVLLHKLGGSLQEWRHLLPALVPHHRVVAVDLPGHGRSRMPGPPPFIVSHEAIAADLISVLDELDITAPCLFVGSSVGASVALACAALWPARVSGVVSLGAAFTAAVPLASIRAKAQAAIEAGEYAADESPVPRPVARLQAMFGIEDASIAHEFNCTRSAAGRWVAPVARGAERCDLVSLARRVSVPVTLAFGVRGNYQPYVEQASSSLPRSRIVPIEGSGAFPHEEAPESTLRVIRSAVEDL
jgi:pimeloyl-ACP methyl ester carboxylesterase